MRQKRWVGALVAVLLLLVVGGAPQAERGAAATPAHPNVLFLLTDDQTYESVSSAVMPYLSSGPYGGWTSFSNAFLNTALCCPSRATLLSGRYSYRTGVENNYKAHLFDERNTLPVWLHAAGYRTALIGKYFNGYPFGRGSYVPPGWDRWYEEWGYEGYDIYEDGQPKRVAPAGLYSTDDLASQALSFIDSTPSDTPFFAYVSYTAPHSPWKLPARHANLTVPSPPDRPNFNEADVADKPAWVRQQPLLTAAQKTADRANRQASYKTLRAVDESIEAMLERLASTSRLEDTVVVFMTDNGFSYGEHRWADKRCPYDECTRTPLLVRRPGDYGQTRTLPNVVGEVDVTSTILALAGASPTIAQDGRSLLPLLNGQSSGWRDSTLLHWGGGTSNSTTGTGLQAITKFDAIRTRDYLWVEYGNGDRELYDLAADPWMLKSQHNNASYLLVRQDLHNQLAALK